MVTFETFVYKTKKFKVIRIFIANFQKTEFFYSAINYTRCKHIHYILFTLNTSFRKLGDYFEKLNGNRYVVDSSGIVFLVGEMASFSVGYLYRITPKGYVGFRSACRRC